MTSLLNIGQRCVWSGLSGTKYEFHIEKNGALLPQLPGLYIFFRIENGVRVPIYVGETSNLKNRLNDDWLQHHQRDCIVRNGATHLSIWVFGGPQSDRLIYETDLRRGLNPSCNRQ